MAISQHEVEAAAAALRAVRAARDAALERALQKLDSALAQAADILAGLSAEEWSALRYEEYEDTLGAMQLWDAFGMSPDRMMPERVIGARVIEWLEARHPLLVQEPAGAA